MAQGTRWQPQTEHTPEHQPAPGHQEQDLLQGQLTPAKPAYPPHPTYPIRPAGGRAVNLCRKKMWDTQGMLVKPLQFRKTCPLATQPLTPVLLTLQRTLILLFNIKLAILLLHLLKSLPRATDPEASEGPSLTWRAEFICPDNVPVGTTISKSSQSQRGEIPPHLFSWEENALWNAILFLVTVENWTSSFGHPWHPEGPSF